MGSLPKLRLAVLKRLRNTFIHKWIMWDELLHVDNWLLAAERKATNFHEK